MSRTSPSTVASERTVRPRRLSPWARRRPASYPSWYACFTSRCSARQWARRSFVRVWDWVMADLLGGNGGELHAHRTAPPLPRAAVLFLVVTYRDSNFHTTSSWVDHRAGARALRHGVQQVGREPRRDQD